MDIKKIVPQELIWAEVTSDLQLMFEQKNNLGSDSPYGRMTDIEFANDRKKRTMANIPGWFGWDGSYGSILATRIAKKTGYKTTQSDISLLMSKDDSTYVNAAIQAAIDIYLDNIIISLSAAVLGRKGGSVKSDRKAKSSAENGKKGGRPNLKYSYDRDGFRTQS